MEAELEPGGAQGCSARPWLGSVLSPRPVLAVPRGGAQPYLGFVDGAVESVVLLVVEQTEIQRPQRGCKGRRDAINPGADTGCSPWEHERRAWGCQRTGCRHHKTQSVLLGALVGGWWPFPCWLAQPWERSERDERMQLCRHSLCFPEPSPGLSPSLSSLTAASSLLSPRR